MKKVVRMLGLCALVALAFTSCKKNETNSVTFKASMPQTISDSRTHINQSNWVVWDDGNQITVFNNDGSAYIEPILETRNQTNATFSGDANFLADIETPNQYTAFYPVADNDGTDITFDIPAQQSYVEDSFEDNLYPMYATNNNTGGTNFQFKSQAGLLTIPVKMGQDATHAYTIKKIVVTATDNTAQLYGKMTYNYAAPYAALPTYGRSDTGYEVELINCDAQGALTTDARFFNIVLLEGCLQGENSFILTLYDENDNVIPIYNDYDQLVSPLYGGTPYGIEAQTRTMMNHLVLK
jgi:hypothetical protein